jgi:gamma-glutamyl:cysteine ligase YbdK (ATP-grasp superfamily)
MLNPLAVFGPEHEFAVVTENIQPLAIVDHFLKDLYGRFVNTVTCNGYALSKELQTHVMEIKSKTPFTSPQTFEECMYAAVVDVNEILARKYQAHLLGTGMHPTLNVANAVIWPHRGRKLFAALDTLFDLHQHGWVNIHAFQLNLPYGTEKEAITIYNSLTNLLPYLPAITAASPIYDSQLSPYHDARLHFYRSNQVAIPSITGQVIPEYISSFAEYRQTTIDQYTYELQQVNAPSWLFHREWLNSRGAIFRFDRRAIEIRIIDEQECIYADVAISCFIRACLRGIIKHPKPFMPYQLLTRDFNAVIEQGLDAKVHHPYGPTARDVCSYYLRIASENASPEEAAYLSHIKARIEEGSLATLIRRDLQHCGKNMAWEDAITHIYQKLVTCLARNHTYFSS